MLIYHWMFNPENRAEAFELLRRYGAPTERLDWIAIRIARIGCHNRPLNSIGDPSSQASYTSCRATRGLLSNNERPLPNPIRIFLCYLCDLLFKFSLFASVSA
jgi:hypothetical protein